MGPRLVSIGGGKSAQEIQVVRNPSDETMKASEQTQSSKVQEHRTIRQGAPNLTLQCTMQLMPCVTPRTPCDAAHNSVTFTQARTKECDVHLDFVWGNPCPLPCLYP